MTKTELEIILENINDKALQYALNEATDPDDGDEVCGLQADFFFEDFEEWFIAQGVGSNWVVELLVEHKDLRDRFMEMADGFDVVDFFEEFLSPSERELF